MNHRCKTITVFNMTVLINCSIQIRIIKCVMLHFDLKYKQFVTLKMISEINN